MEFLENILDKIIENYKTYLIYAIIFIVLVIFIVFIIKRINRSKNFKHLLKNLEDKENSIINTDISYKLSLISSLGQYNTSYLSVFNDYKAQYEELVKNCSEFFDEKTQLLKDAYSHRSFRKINQIRNEIENELSNFKDKSDTLYGKICLICKDEEELKNRKETFDRYINSLKIKLDKTLPNLKFLSNQIDSLIIELNNFEQAFNNYMLHGNFNDANSLIDKISVKYRYIYENIDNLITYSTEVSVTIPGIINSLIATYNNLKSANFQIDQIPVIKTINESKQIWMDIVNQLREFNFDNVENEISRIHIRIGEVNKLIEEEKKAYDEYKEIYDSIYNEAIDLDNDYINKLHGDLLIKKKFESNPLRSQIDKDIKYENQKLAVIKSSLDALSYSKQPYTKRLAKLKELKEQCERFKSSIEKSNSNYDELQKISDDASTYLVTVSSKIREIEINIRNSHLDKLNAKYAEDFSTIYNLINRLNNVLNTIPVDVDRASILKDDIFKKFNELQISSTNDIAYALECEKLIMRGNNLRPVYPNLDSALDRCEILYNDGRYKESYEMLKDLLDDFNNGMEN